MVGTISSDAFDSAGVFGLNRRSLPGQPSVTGKGGRVEGWKVSGDQERAGGGEHTAVTIPVLLLYTDATGRCLGGDQVGDVYGFDHGFHDAKSDGSVECDGGVVSGRNFEVYVP